MTIQLTHHTSSDPHVQSDSGSFPDAALPLHGHIGHAVQDPYLAKLWP